MATNELAGITLAVDVSQVDRGTQSLQKFRQANQQAASGISEFVNAEQVAKNQARDTARALSEQQASLAKLQTAIDPTAAKFRKLQEAAVGLDKAFAAGVVPDEEFFRLGEALETQNAKLARSRAALTEEGRAAAQAAKDKAKAKAEADRFIASLERQAQAATLTREEYLKLQAAQLGVSSQAAPIIDRIADASQKANTQLIAQSKAFQKSGLSAGQYKNAISQLPAQITDIGTSLAGGIPIWLIAIQQGGQIKDAFGGIGNTFRFALAALNPFNVAVGVLGGVLVALGVGAAQAESEFRALNSAISFSNNSTIASISQVRELVSSVSDATGATRGLVTSIATSLIEQGNLTLTQIEKITKSTARWAQLTGKDAKEITGYYNQIASDQIQGLVDLDKRFNFLTQGQLTTIENLRKTKGEVEAVTAAIDIFSKSQEANLNDIAAQLTPLELAWNDFRKYISDIWDAISRRTAGALNLFVDVIAGTIEQIRVFINQGDVLIGEFVISATQALQNIPGLDGVGGDVIKSQQKIIDAAKKQNLELEKSIKERDARIREGELGYVTRRENQNTNEQSGTDEEFAKRKKALQDELDAIKKNRKEENGRVKEQRDLTIGYESGVLALQAQLKVLQENRGIGAVISNERKQYLQDEAKFRILEQRQLDGSITKEQSRLLLEKDKVLELARQKAELGDQIVLQERANKLAEDNRKKILQINNEAKNIDLGAGLSSREQQRAKEIQALQSNQVNAGGAIDDVDFQQLLEARRNFYAQEDALRENWLAGVNQSFANWAESATDAFSIAGSLTTTVFEGITDQITDLVTTGETNFREFTVNILKQIAKIAAQLLIVKAIESSLSSFGGTGGVIGSIASAIGGGFANGGYTGNGGKYQPAGTVHRGEFVFTKEATSRIGVKNLYALMKGYANGGVVGGPSGYANGGLVSGGTDVNVSGITVNVNSGIGSDPEQAKALQNGVKAIVAEEISQSFQQGGKAYAYLRGFN